MPQTDSIDLIISSRKKDIGGFDVRRVLPYEKRRMIGPFIFFDHMGPAVFPPGKGIDVRAHPHIGLATVTFLFDGEIHHRDSLGFYQPIQPGDVNWMTAGRGIVHSERTGPETRAAGHTLHGIQTWIALPKDHEETEPEFHHHPGATLPVIEQDGAKLRLIAGSAYGETSPVQTFSPMFYLGGTLAAEGALTLTTEHEERAVYIVEGTAEVDGETLEDGQMAVLKPGAEAVLSSESGTKIMLFSGAPMDGERLIWWNLAASRQDLIDRAKQEWKDEQFPKIPGDDDEFIPLPEGWAHMSLRKHYIGALIFAVLVLVVFPQLVVAQVSVIGGTTGVPEGTAGYEKWMMFADRVAEMSGGEITVTPMVGGELGGEETIFSAMRRGRVQVANLSGLVIGALVPELALLQAPYLFGSEAEADHLYDTILFDVYSNLLAEHGLVLLSWDDVGFRHVYGKMPILVPADLRDMRYRIPTGLATQLFAEAMGSDVIQLSFNDNIIGLQTGLVDAGGNAIILYASTGIAEEAPQLTLTGHINMTNLLICTEQWLTSLSEPHQTVIREGWIPIDLARKMSRDETNGFLQQADEIGFSIHRLTPTQKDAWRAATAPVTDQLIETIGGRSGEIYQTILDARATFRASR